jgi:hypothetical protein
MIQGRNESAHFLWHERKYVPNQANTTTGEVMAYHDFGADPEHYQKVRQRAIRIRRIRMDRLMREDWEQYNHQYNRLSPREQRELELFRQAQRDYARNSYGMMPQGLLITSDGLPKEDLSNVTFWGKGLEELLEVQKNLGGHLLDLPDLPTGTDEMVVITSDKARALYESCCWDLSKRPERVVGTWKCPNHPPGLELDVPVGERCEVCGRGE